MIKSLLQIILLIREKISHGCGWGGDKVSEGTEDLNMYWKESCTKCAIKVEPTPVASEHRY